MKFIDEVKVNVEAGNGGNGCLSFRREKFIPFGGPNGGDGGDGGSVYLVATDAINTLIEYQFQPLHRAQKGEHGKGSNCTGRSGEDLALSVPVGTVIYDYDTGELIADLKRVGEKVLVAKGGQGGLGNTRFKSSTNRAPRQITPGQPGEKRQLRLELKLLADVGLLGFPNAGKSTLIRAVSAARPKVADYPFTTLHPKLGVVRNNDQESFVIADIPGLIAGASSGTGLGIRFLKHLARTTLLLHVVDLNDIEQTPLSAIETLTSEIALYDPKLADRERWLVFNKADLFLPEDVDKKVQEITKQINWQGKVFLISAISGKGTKELCHAIFEYFREE